jgi:hypothetical protein
MANKTDYLQALLLSDPVPIIRPSSSPEAYKLYVEELSKWLNRLITKLTSDNIQKGLDSIV